MTSREYVVGLVCVLLPLAASTAALAQGSGERLKAADSAAESRVQLGTSALGPDLSKLGFVVTDGVVLMPTIAFESGYDTNHDGRFDDPDGSPYGLIDGGVVLGWINARGATTLGVRGSVVQFNDEVQNDTRWDASVVLDNAYRMAPGLVATFGGFYSRDELYLIPSEIFGAYGKLDYFDAEKTGYLRVGHEQTRYYGDVPFDDFIDPALSPFVQNNEFSYRRGDLSAGLLHGRNKPIGFYADATASRFDYFDQDNEQVVDRDANEFSAAAGVRVAFAKNLVLDAGYRFNYRDFESDRVSHDSTGFVDGRLTWLPISNLAVVLEVDRRYQEPISAFALATELTNYGARAIYTPSPLVELALFGYFREYEQIGDDDRFDKTIVGASAAYALTSTVQLYGAVGYEHVENNDGGEYDAVRVGLGTRVKVRPGHDVADLLPGPGGEAAAILPSGIVLQAGVAWSRISFDTSNYAAQTDYFVDSVTDHPEADDGELDGRRFEAGVSGLARRRLGGFDSSLGLKGFYADYDSSEQTRCQWSEDGDCVFVPFVDASPIQNNYSGGLFSDWCIDLDHETRHYGVAIEANFQRPDIVSASLKDTVVVSPDALRYRAGLAYKAIDQEIALDAEDRNFFVPATVAIREELRTDYFGAYIGFDVTKQLWWGVVLSISGEGGLYYARTNYDGSYEASESGFGGVGGGPVSQRLSLNDDDAAFIGALSIDLKKQFGIYQIGIYAETEWYSQAPTMVHNDTDRGLFSLAGRQDGSRLEDGSAFVYTIGTRVGVPLN